MLPLFAFDGQLLFKYGLSKSNQTCNEPSNYLIKQFRQAIKHPTYVADPIVPNYHPTWLANVTPATPKGNLCFRWNAVDIILYAMLPFSITLICSVVIIVKVLQRRRSTMNLGSMYHPNGAPPCSQECLSTTLITINMLFLLMVSPLNVLLVVQSVFGCLLARPLPTEPLRSVEEYLRLLQNSYHALSFIFYCVMGKKFRHTAKSICRNIYYKLFEFGIAQRCTDVPLLSCCIGRRRSSSSGHTTSTNARISDARRIAIERRRSSPMTTREPRRLSCVTFHFTVKNAQLTASAL